MARQKKIDLEHMTEKEKMKYEIAGELGLLERVLNDGKRDRTDRRPCDTAEAAGGGRTEREVIVTV